MKLSKEQVSGIIGAVIAAVVAILAVLGYNVFVLQPELAAMTEKLLTVAVGGCQ